MHAHHATFLHCCPVVECSAPPASAAIIGAQRIFYYGSMQARHFFSVTLALWFSKRDLARKIYSTHLLFLSRYSGYAGHWVARSRSVCPVFFCCCERDEVWGRRRAKVFLRTECVCDEWKAWRVKKLEGVSMSCGGFLLSFILVLGISIS